MSLGLAPCVVWCTFLVVVDPGTNSSGPGAIPFSGSRLRLVGLDVVQHDAPRQPPVVRAHDAARGARESARRAGDSVEINFRNVAREMRLASHAPVSPASVARVEARRPVVNTPALTPMDKARLDRLVAGKVEQRREARGEAADRANIGPVLASPVASAQSARRAHRANAAVAQDDLDLVASDARFRFASEVARQLEGGKAAILRPERRDVLVARAERDGILAFDANLVIALVQDATRRGDLVTPSMIQPPARSESGAEAYEAGVRDHLIAVVSSMRVAALLPLVRVSAGAADANRSATATAFAQATIAVVLAALLLVGMVATLGT